MLRPPPLRPGDRISVVAPSSPFEREAFERGLARLSGRYRPEVEPGLFSTVRYLAGSDERRLTELSHALERDDTRAVFCARGGYGALRILSRLKLPPKPKLLVGFSDITAFHATLQAAGWASVHGPVVTQLGRMEEQGVQDLFRLLEDSRERPVLRGQPVVPGQAEGRVIGGNLSVLTRLLGTPFLPPLEGAILFFEDVGERPYRLDRMWQHLALSGALDRVAGIAMGAFIDCEEPGNGWGPEQVLRELALARGLPCLMGLPVGHAAQNRPFALGARALLDGSAGTLSFLEGAVR
jgi:muramoyltetrapeptide carboxypeptidase